MYWQDFVWVVCVVVSNVLFYIRKSILVKHGHRIDFMDFEMKDRCRLKEIISTEPSVEKKRVMTLLNNSIWIFFLLGVVVLVLFRVMGSRVSS